MIDSERREQHQPERGGDGVAEEGGDVLALAVLSRSRRAECRSASRRSARRTPWSRLSRCRAGGDQLIDVGVRRLAQVGQRVTGDGDQEEHEERRREQDRDGDQHAANDEEEHERGAETKRVCRAGARHTHFTVVGSERPGPDQDSCQEAAFQVSPFCDGLYTTLLGVVAVGDDTREAEHRDGGQVLPTGSCRSGWPDRSAPAGPG